MLCNTYCVLFTRTQLKKVGFTKINRSVGRVLEFQQNEPKYQPQIVTLMNNKVAAISKTMELPGDK